MAFLSRAVNRYPPLHCTHCIYTTRWSPDGGTLAVASEDSFVYLYNCGDYIAKAKCAGHNGPVRDKQDRDISIEIMWNSGHTDGHEGDVLQNGTSRVAYSFANCGHCMALTLNPVPVAVDLSFEADAAAVESTEINAE